MRTERLTGRGVRRKAAVTFVAAAATLFLATEADAESLDGSFRLGLDGTALGLDHVTLSSNDAAVNSAITTLGLPGVALGVAFGYGVSNNLFLGARLTASSINSKVGDTSVATTGFGLFPQFEYLFPGAVVRPFASANLGYRAIGASGGAETSTSTFLIGPGAGLHVFPSSSLSLDAGVMTLFQKGTSKAGDAELDTTGYSVLLTVGLSGWLGGSSNAASPAPALPTPPNPPATDQGSATVDEASVIESTFTLDRPNASGGVRITIQGDPRKDANKVKVIVTSLQSRPATSCGPLAFEVAGARTELTDMRSSSRGGFGSLTTQAGSLPLDALGRLTDTDHEAWLELCDERVLVLVAAKRRVERFIGAFRHRLQTDPSARSP